MKCNKCGYTLPDDSVFCQYCGVTLEQSPEKPMEVPAEPVIEKPIPIVPAEATPIAPVPEAPKAVTVTQAAMDQHLYDPDYGFVPHKPIYTAGLEGGNLYLSLLRTVAGSPVKWKHRETVSVDGVQGTVDAFDLYLSSGDRYRTLFLNLHSTTNSMHPPVGFYLASQPSKKSAMASRLPKKEPKVKTQAVKTESDKKSKKKPWGTWALSAVSVLLAIALGLTLFQNHVLRTQNAEHLAQLNTTREKVDELEAANDKQTSTINSQKEIITSLYPRASSFSDLCNYLGSRLGYGSNDFKASEGFIVVRKDEKNRKFTLTANWNDGDIVLVSESSSAASISFNNNSWPGTATVTIHPKSVGLTIVTFYKSSGTFLDVLPFRVLILVVE